MNLTSDIMGDWSIREDFCMDDLNTVVKVEDLSAIDPYPFYPILDGAGDMCTGKPGDGCDVCGPTETHLSSLGMIPCHTQLPLLEWSDVEDQLGEPEQDEMRCVNINQIFNMAEKAAPQDKVIVEHTDKVISDCMWSSSSAHRLDMSDLGTSPLPALSVESDVGFGRPDTPQTDSESHFTDSDDLIQRVPKEESIERRLSPVPEKPAAAVSSGRSLLKRNQFSVKVARAPLRPESKPALPSPSGDSSYSGDHSYSATNCIGILTPSPSPSESSSEDDNNSDARTGRHHARRRAPVDSQALQERLLHRPLKARKRTTGAMKYRSDRCRMPSDDDQAPPERRNNHNNMERMRRDLLRGALNSLRRLVPDTAGNDKAPKITVLREAAKYCLMLRSKEEMLNKQKRRLEEQRATLQRRLELLQRNVCH
ncbi:myc proto-oncogene protein-like isoform X2 [Amphibalanus amphitrite]|nr:myc proto-oncogene protein-like [Amphibalanus amphitrite]XP_043198428.1 myc proto-oncogene protein-like [Amphibalanus amphitrite]XP_043246161.1 myc proto-oncogene protein-like isoform X2 [Amphibalanus amphitrite]